ncbi:Ig-like domain-containing protein [Mesobacillus subterraneus]|uniref:Ig-like domain-containing protein n=1 Tax=Mesobacillus subterraneus TaxID=285983 RepID=UPI00203B0B9E|nr:Ig-like domain-containing protein [Mesobacillus subterraneus]MCM3664687.1 Ig-like domain-containing protein [Mesobacillus subterraneus]MCM3683799.1 Ig-like domain-containing protein [Mesobacillus subterraneus]
MIESRRKKKTSMKWAIAIPVVLVLISSILVFNGRVLSNLWGVSRNIEFNGQAWDMLSGSFNKDWKTNSDVITFTVDLTDDFENAALTPPAVRPFNVIAAHERNQVGGVTYQEVGGDQFAGKYTVNVPFNEDGRLDLTVEMLENDAWSIKASTHAFSITRDATAPEVNLTGITDGALSTLGVTVDVEVIEKHFASNTVTVTATRNGKSYTSLPAWKNTAETSKNPYSFTQEGEYTLTVNAKDEVGNSSPEKTIAFSIRTKGPVLSISGNGTELSRAGVTNSKELDLKVTSGISLGTATVTIFKDGKQVETQDMTVSGWEASLKYPVSGDGEYEFRVWAKESHKNGQEYNLEPFQFTADQTPPKLAVNGVAEGETYESDQEVKVTVEDLHYGTAEFNVTKTDITGKTTPVSVAVKDGQAKYTTAGEGQYTVILAAEDNAGNKAEPQTVTFKIDKEKPVLSISEDVNGKHFKEDKELTIAVEDITLDLAKTVLEVKKGAETYNIGTLLLNLFKAEVRHNFTEEGTYEINLSSKDGKNRSNTIEPVIFTIDKTPPVIKGEVVEKENESKKVKDVIVAISDKNIDWKNTSLTVTKNGIKLAGITGEEVSKTHSFQDDGNYKIELEAADKAGNKTIHDPINFTIDNTQPELKIDGVTDGEYYQKLENLELSIEDLTFLLNKTTIEVLKDGQPYDLGEGKWDEIMSNGGLKKAFRKLSFYEDGNYEISLKTTDLFGNENKLGPVKFTIDNSAPVLEIKNISNGQEVKEALEVTATLVDKNVDWANTYLNVTRNGHEYLKENGEKVFEPKDFTEDGIYTIEMEATDKAGNRSVLGPITFTVDNTKPELKISGVEDGEHYQKLENLELSIEDLTFLLNKTAIEVLKDGKPFEVGEGKWDESPLKGGYKKAIRKLSFTEDGDYEISLINSDRVGNENKIGPVKFTIDSINPLIDISGIDEGAFVQKGKSVTIKVKEHNFEQNDVKISVSRKEELEGPKKQYNIGVWKNTAEESILSYTFDEDGDYEILVEAKDKAANNGAAKKLTFTVDNKKPVIKISGPLEDAYYNKGTNVKIAVEERNFKNNNVNIAVTRMIEVDGKKVSFPIGEWKNVDQVSDLSHEFDQDGEYEITVNAKDAAGNQGDTETIHFTVDKIDPELSITGVEDNNNYRTDKPVTVKITDRNIDLSRTELKVEKNGKVYSIGEPALTSKTAAGKSFTFSEEGSFKIDLNTVDKAGNKKVHDTIAFIIDKTNPVVKIDGVENNSFNPAAKSVIISVDELNFTTNNVDISATKDGADFNIGKWNNGSKLSKLGYNFNKDGLYTILATAKDKAGNGPISQKMTFTVDKVKPAIEIKGVENNAYYKVDKPVSIAIRDVNLDINRVSVTRSGAAYGIGGFSVKNGVASLSHNFSKEGDYSILVEAIDKAGNSFSSTMKFTIDKTKPVITPKFKGQNRVIKNGEYINEVFTPEFALDEREDMIVSATLNNGGNLGNNIPVAAREMSYTYKVLARDKAGNESTLEISFTLDTTKPLLNISGVLDGFFNKDIAPKVTYSDVHLDRSKTSVTLNGKPFKNGTKLEYEQDYILKAVVTDLAKNVSTRTIVFTIDKTSPVIKFKEPISNQYFNTDLLPQLLIEDMSAYDIIAMMLDGKPYEAGDPIKEEGKHVMFFEVKDKAGNIQQLSVEFIIDKTAPKVIFEGVKEKEKYYDPVEISIRLDNPNDDLKSVLINGELFEGDVIEENGIQVIKTTLAEIKSYKIEVTAIDDAGNEKVAVLPFEIVKKGALVKFYENKPLLGGTLAGAFGLLAAAATVFVRRRKLKVEEE